MMDSKIHSLPPLKRFRLLQQQQSDDLSSSLLPAKKRKEPRNYNPPISSDSIPTIHCLPAKKRVWALPPSFSPTKSDSSFDLNVEYNPTFSKDSQRQHPNSPIPLVPVESPLSTETARGKDEERSVEEQKGENGNEDQVEVNEDEDDGIVCAVCESTDGDPSDPIVFCDGCNLMVHATCYGNPLVKGVPEGDWFCAKCLASQSSCSSSVSSLENATDKCCLCPVTGGALKPTNHGRWAHLLCALYVPEVFFEDPNGREGIDCSKVPKRRWKEVCYVCNGSNGCTIECSEPKCELAFHVTCGLKEGLCIEYREGRSSKGAGIVAGFCKKHTKLWEKQQQTGKFKIVARDEHK